MATTLYIIRHGEAEGNIYRRIQGHFNGGITPRGKRQIQRLRKRLEGIKFDAVYSSDLTRAVETAMAAAGPNGLKPIIRADLREFSFGPWEDLPWGEAFYAVPEVLINFNRNPLDYYIEGAETYPQVAERMVKAITEICENHPNQVVAVFTHGSALRTFLCMATGTPLDDTKAMGHADNTAVSVLTYENGQFTPIQLNDASHLGEDSTLARQSWWKNALGFESSNLRYTLMDPDEYREAYIAFRSESWEASLGEKLPRTLAEGFWEEACELYRRFPQGLVLGWLTDDLAGMIQIDPLLFEQEKVINIPFYYMKPEYRRLGIGVQLLGCAVTLGRQMGMKSIRLRTFEKNEVALRFYRRNGFKDIGSEATAFGLARTLEFEI